MPVSSLMKTSSVSLCLAWDLPSVHTCRHARDCGAPPPGENSMGVRLSTCHGQMVRRVERTCGAWGQNVCRRIVGGGRLWMVGGDSGRGKVCIILRYEIRWLVSWSDCSRTCGGGIRKSVRECDNPSPTYGGLYCTGDKLRYESCQTKDCQHASDFRLEQCRAFDGNNFKIDDLPSSVQWVPKYSESKHHCSEKLA